MASYFTAMTSYNYITVFIHIPFSFTSKWVLLGKCWPSVVDGGPALAQHCSRNSDLKLTLKTLELFRINHGEQRVFRFEIIINIILIHLNTYVIGLRPSVIFLLLQQGDRL